MRPAGPATMTFNWRKYSAPRQADAMVKLIAVSIELRAWNFNTATASPKAARDQRFRSVIYSYRTWWEFLSVYNDIYGWVYSATSFIADITDTLRTQRMWLFKQCACVIKLVSAFIRVDRFCIRPWRCIYLTLSLAVLGVAGITKLQNH